MDAGIQASHTPVFDNHLRGAESAELGVALNDGIGLRAGLLGLGEHGNLSAHLREFERTGYEGNDRTGRSAGRKEAGHGVEVGPGTPRVRYRQRRAAAHASHPCIVGVLGALVDGERNCANKRNAR